MATTKLSEEENYRRAAAKGRRESPGTLRSRTSGRPMELIPAGPVPVTGNAYGSTGNSELANRALFGAIRRYVR
jgi:hypothetical protein